MKSHLFIKLAALTIAALFLLTGCSGKELRNPSKQHREAAIAEEPSLNEEQSPSPSLPMPGLLGKDRRQSSIKTPSPGPQPKPSPSPSPPPPVDAAGCPPFYPAREPPTWALFTVSTEVIASRGETLEITLRLRNLDVQAKRYGTSLYLPPYDVWIVSSDGTTIWRDSFPQFPLQEPPRYGTHFDWYVPPGGGFEWMVQWSQVACNPSTGGFSSDSVPAGFYQVFGMHAGFWTDPFQLWIME